MQGIDPSRAKRPGYIGSAFERMHLHRAAHTVKKDETPSALEETTPRLTRSHAPILILALLISTFLTMTLIAPMVTTIDSNGTKVHPTYEEHSAIMITSDDGFTLSGSGVTPGGDGSASNPYVIENWDINASAFPGIWIMDTTLNFTIRNVHVYGAGGFMIYLYNAPNGTVENSLFDDGAAGIIGGNCDNLKVTGNVIKNQDMFAVDIVDSSRVNISGNQFEDNNISAIALINTDNSTIGGNTILRTNVTGILVGESNYTAIVDNNASDSPGIGLLVSEAREMLVMGNDFTNNQMYGVHLDLCANVTVFHNRFVGNGVHAYSDNSTNVSWDGGYPAGGNYWSNYTGPDEKSGVDQDQPGPDGMGDIPFYTDGSGVDRYPWLADDFGTIPEFGTVMPVVAGVLVIALVSSLRRKTK